MTRTCQHCDATFEVNDGRGNRKRWCYDCLPPYGKVTPAEYHQTVARLRAVRRCPDCTTRMPPGTRRCYICRPIPPPKPPRPKSTRPHRRRDGGLTRHQRGYGHQWDKLRLVILSRDAYICAYCDRYADTVDHIKPKAEGGDDDPANLVAACRSCNSRRAAQWLNLQRRLRAADQ